jgi:methylmalonyl-CoA mutase
MSLQEEWVNQLKKELKSSELRTFHSEIEDLRWEFTDNNTLLPSFDFSLKYHADLTFFSFYKVIDSIESNREILQDLNQGTQGLILCWDILPDLHELFKGVMFEYIQTRIIISNPEELLIINHWIGENNPKNFTVEFMGHGTDTVQRIDGFSMNAIGSNAWQELSFVCQQLVQQLSVLPKNAPLVIELGVGENFMIEAAKITAFHWLCEALLTKHNRMDLNITLRARLGWRNKSHEELHTNQIRQSSEALCALVAGVNQLCIPPYDAMFTANSTALSRRMAVNIGHLLKEEAHLDWFHGLIKGSHIATHLVHQLCNKVWDALAWPDAFEDRLKESVEATIACRIQRINDQSDRFIGINDLYTTGENRKSKTPQIGAFGLPYLFFETN